MRAKKIYVIKSDGGPVKIGISSDPDVRRQALESHGPNRLTLVHTRDVDVPGAVERAAHRLLSDHRRKGEWFDVSVADAIAAIDAALIAGGSQLLTFRADPESLAALDALRRDEEDIPTRSEMVRRVIRRAVEAHAKKRK